MMHSKDVAISSPTGRVPLAILFCALSASAFNVPGAPLLNRASRSHPVALGRAGGAGWAQGGAGSPAIAPIQGRSRRLSPSPLLSLRSAAVTQLEEEELLKGAVQPEKCPECFEPLPKNVRARFCENCGAEFVPSKIGHWTNREARVKQFRNADLELSSSCGVCSVLTALAMLGKITKNTPLADELVADMTTLVRNRACDNAGSNCRHGTLTADSQCDVTLSEHLVGRSECGSSGSAALIDKVESHFGDVVGASLPIGTELPMEKASVLEWVAGWIHDGGAVCVTYNRQKALRGEDESAIPDCWHAQAIFSVDLKERTAGLTNPMKMMTEEDLVRYLPSEPVLKVRGSEALFHARRMHDDDIRGIVWPNERWTELKVTEQLLALREKYHEANDWMEAKGEMVTIPYAGTGEGVGPCFRVFAKRNSAAGQRIMSARERGEALVMQEGGGAGQTSDEAIDRQVDEELAEVEAAAKEVAERRSQSPVVGDGELGGASEAEQIRMVAEAEKERLLRVREQVKRDVAEAGKIMRSRSAEGRVEMAKEIKEAKFEERRLSDEIRAVEDAEKARYEEIRLKVKRDVEEGEALRAQKVAQEQEEEEKLAEEERIRAYEEAEKARLEALRRQVAQDALDGEEMIQRQEAEAIAAEQAKVQEERRIKEEAAAVAREERKRVEAAKLKAEEERRRQEEVEAKARGKAAAKRIHEEVESMDMEELKGSRMLEPSLQDKDKSADLDQRVQILDQAIKQEEASEVTKTARYEQLKAEVQELVLEEERQREERERKDNAFKVPHDEWMRRLAEDRQRKIENERKKVEHDEWMKIDEEERQLREEEKRIAKRVAMKKFKDELHKIKLQEEKRQYQMKLKREQEEQGGSQ